MDQETADVLATHLQVQAFERRRDDYSDHGLVICAPDGTPPDVHRPGELSGFTPPRR